MADYNVNSLHAHNNVHVISMHDLRIIIIIIAIIIICSIKLEDYYYYYDNNYIFKCNI